MFEGYRHQKIDDKHGAEFDSSQREAFEYLDWQILKILEQLRPPIERGEYRIVLGDDASGRVPALIVAGAIKRIYAKTGVPAQLVRFVAGSRFLEGDDLSAKKALLDTYTNKIKNLLFKEEGVTKSRVLIVTDYIDSGRSIKPLVDAMARGGVDADLATIGLNDGFDSEWAEFRPVAVAQDHVPGVYAERSLSGVIKSPKKLFATPVAISSSADIGVQRKINATREIVEDIASNVAKQFLIASTPKV